MGAAVPIIGAVGTAVGIGQSNSQARANNRQLAAQADALKKELEIRRISLTMDQAVQLMNAETLQVQNRNQYMEQMAELNMQAVLQKSQFGSQMQQMVSEQMAVTAAADAQMRQAAALEKTNAYKRLVDSAQRASETASMAASTASQVAQAGEAIRAGRPDMAAQIMMTTQSNSGRSNRIMQEYERKRADLEELRVALQGNASAESIAVNETVARKLDELYAQLDAATINAAMTQLGLDTQMSAASTATAMQQNATQQKAFNSNVPILETLLSNNALMRGQQIAADAAQTDQALQANKISLDAQFGQAHGQLMAQRQPTTGILESFLRVGMAGAPLFMGQSEQGLPFSGLSKKPDNFATSANTALRSPEQRTSATQWQAPVRTPYQFDNQFKAKVRTVPSVPIKAKVTG